MANRYIELSPENAKLVDDIVNCIASHPHLKLTNKIRTHFNDLKNEIGAKHTMFILLDEGANNDWWTYKNWKYRTLYS